MKRARQAEQKDERRMAIMEEAWRQYQHLPYGEITVAGIARGVGLAKGTVYLYFTGKESLYLAVLTTQFSRWFEELTGRLMTSLDVAQPGIDEPELERASAVARIVTESLSGRPALARLLSESHVILEQNADEGTIVAYKKLLLERLHSLAGPLADALSIGKQDSLVLLLEIYALLVGTQQLSEPAPLVRELIRSRPELTLFDVEFTAFFGDALYALLRGTLEKLRHKSGKETGYE
jgi:AcrR family transcriptional regulator